MRISVAIAGVLDILRFGMSQVKVILYGELGYFDCAVFTPQIQQQLMMVALPALTTSYSHYSLYRGSVWEGLVSFDGLKISFDNDDAA